MFPTSQLANNFLNKKCPYTTLFDLQTSSCSIGVRDRYISGNISYVLQHDVNRGNRASKHNNEILFLLKYGFPIKSYSVQLTASTYIYYITRST